MSVTLNIDGRALTAEEGETILDCALRNGIEIPNLCTHPTLPAFGACRMCVVEIEGMRSYPTSCTTPAAEGMNVQTNTPALQKLRHNILALMMLEHPCACLVCAKRELCEEYRPEGEKAGRTTGCQTCSGKAFCEVRPLAEEFALTELPAPPSYHHRPLDRSNPFIDRDLNLCILCGRCVRVCKQQHGTAVIDFVGRGSETHIGQAFGRSMREAGCRFCGACVDACPNGALADRYAKWYPQPDATTQSTCQFCDEACALELGANDAKLVSATAANQNVPICVLGRFAVPEFLNGSDRMTMPHVRVGEVLREAEWKEAIEATAAGLKDFVGDAFALICDTTSTLEDRHVFRRFTEEVMKSKNYVEIDPDARGVSLGSLPKGAKAAMLAGELVPPAQLDGLDLLIVQDCYPSGASRRAGVVLPVAVFAEVDGTVPDITGAKRPLHKACEPPGQARPQWWIVAQIARAMGAEGFAYDSVDVIRQEMGLSAGDLRIERDEAPPAAQDVDLRRTHFRGHHLDAKVSGLRELPTDSAPAPLPEKTGPEEGFAIIQKREIAPNVHEIVIEAPQVARKAQPGQFVVIMVDERSERVPFTLCDWDAEQGTITLVVLEVGQSSRKLVLSDVGDKLAHVVGPLGIPLEIENYGKVVLSGGCYGIGAVLRISRAMKEAGNRVTVIVEGRSHYKHYYEQKLRDASHELIQTTIDGSAGERGHAIDAITRRLEQGDKMDLVIAVGCPFMMMLTARETEPYKVRTLAALNPIMLDGTGMCGACRVTVGEKTKFACVDGPFFDAHQVDWDELRDRRTAYSADEIHLVGRTSSVSPHAGEKHKCTCST